MDITTKHTKSTKEETIFLRLDTLSIIRSSCPSRPLLKIGLTLLHPSCILPIEGRSEIKAFPLDGERLDRGESLSHMVLFSSSVGERKIMNHFVVLKSFV